MSNDTVLRTMTTPQLHGLDEMIWHIACEIPELKRRMLSEINPQLHDLREAIKSELALRVINSAT